LFILEIEYLPPDRPGRGNVLDLTSVDSQQATAPQAHAPGLFALLRQAIELKASDVYLIANHHPTARVNGQLQRLADAPLPGEQIGMLLDAAGSRGGSAEQAKDEDGSVTVPHEGKQVRFRLSRYRAQGQCCACLRLIRGEVPTLEGLGFPQAVADRIASYENGLVLFTGTTGTGKSSSLAALIQHLVKLRPRHVLTLEEPIEFMFGNKSGSLFSQREVGKDVASFADGLRSGLRQAPDVILVGETRDAETAQMVLSASETGHLVLTTLHTRDAKSAISRFVDLFPPRQHDIVRAQLALGLRTVVSQQLLQIAGGKSNRVLITEVLHNTTQAEVLIRTGRVESLESVLQTGRREGMHTFRDDLQRLIKAGRISPDALERFGSASRRSAAE
jgi:twitching motility protein PilT